MRKEVKVVMLPTERSEIGYRNGHIITRFGEPFTSYGNANPQHLFLTSDEEIKEGDWCYYKTKSGGGKFICQAYKHKDDKRILFDDGTFNRGKGEGITPLKDECKKVIATTDYNLAVIDYDGKDNPLHWEIGHIPQSFIEDYVKAEGRIDKVMVEYEDKSEPTLMEGRTWDDAPGANDPKGRPFYMKKIFKLKLREDNTVIIHPAKERLYTKEEVFRLLHAMNKRSHNRAQGNRVIEFLNLDEWIKENL